MTKLDVYLERADRRVFAGAIEWPGLDRSGKDDAAALEALGRAIPRYRRVVERAGIERPPADDDRLDVVEEVRGDAGTAFGIPSIGPSADGRPAPATTIARLLALLDAAWAEFDAAVAGAGDRELRKGPRGGGRDVAKMRSHVLEAEGAYVAQIGGIRPSADDDGRNPDVAMREVREAAREALTAITRGEPLQVSPRRKAALWTPRYFVRRSAWHSLDHTWEIEDRVEA